MDDLTDSEFSGVKLRPFLLIYQLLCIFTVGDKRSLNLNLFTTSMTRAGSGYFRLQPPPRRTSGGFRLSTGSPGSESVSSESSALLTPLAGDVQNEHWLVRSCAPRMPDTKVLLSGLNTFAEKNIGMILVAFSQLGFAFMNTAAKEMTRIEPTVSPFQVRLSACLSNRGGCAHRSSE